MGIVLQSKFYLAIIMLRFIVLSALVACALAMPGGWNEMDANDAAVDDILGFYFSSNGKHPATLAVKSMQTQVVSGVNYKITFFIGRSLKECEAVIYDQPRPTPGRLSRTPA